MRAFWSPNPGSARRRASTSAPVGSPSAPGAVQILVASPSYSSTTTRASSCTRPAIERP